jgi:hypothetical protein
MDYSKEISFNKTQEAPVAKMEAPLPVRRLTQWVQPASVQNGRRPRVIFRMSAANRVARGSIKIPWNKFGYDRLPERFSRSLPGSKRKKKPQTHKEWPVVRGDLVNIKF